MAHNVQVEKSSLLEKTLGKNNLAVNSLHHQAVKAIAPSLRAVAWAEDEVIEALELPNHPFGLGVQWHPEELVNSQSESLKLFDAFIKASGTG